MSAREQDARDAGRRVLRRSKYLLGHDPLLLPVLLRLTPLGLSRQITPHTDLVIEGFPRAGNTFTVFAVKQATRHRLNVVSHVHHPAQVKHAVRRGVPTLLVVREPVATLTSYLVFGRHAKASQVLKEYASYHRELVPYTDGLIVADFDEVTTNLSGVIARLNERFALQIPPFDQSPVNVERVFDEISSHHALIHAREDPAQVVPRPMAGRDGYAQRRRSELLDPRRHGLLAEARKVYEFFKGKAGEQRADLRVATPHLVGTHTPGSDAISGRSRAR